MGTAESEVITVERDGVSIEKTYEPDEFPVPAIAFTVRSGRDEPVSVRFVDVLPDEVEPGDVGFHPDFGEELWSVEDGHIVFEREFDPDEEYTTVYAVRDSDIDTVGRFLVEPEIHGVDPDPPVRQDNSQVVRDVLAGDSSTVPGLDDDVPNDDGDDEEVEPIDLSDPSVSSASGDADSGTAGGVALGDVPETVSDPDTGVTTTDDDAPSPTPVTEAAGDATSVAATLADELREGTVDEETEAVLREELGVETGDSGSGSTDARIQHLQTQVGDLQAYTSALEEFLDENGTARQLLDGLEDDLDALDERLDDLSATVEGNASSVDGLEGSVRDVETELEEVETLTDHLENVESDLDGRLSSIEGDIDEIRDDIESFREFRQSVSNVFGGVDDGGEDEGDGED